MYIFGAGIAGLIAATQFQQAEVIEAGPENSTNHKALLRFRSSKVGDAVGIDFRKVRVHKGIWADGEFHQPSIMLANQYSQKVINKLADRSIWNIEPSDRYIAPEDFIEQLINRVGKRITWSQAVNAEDIKSATDQNRKMISTVPMNIMAKILGISTDQKFTSAPIKVERYRVRNADVFQTIYFPSPETNLYRASITKDLLILEYIQSAENPEANDDNDIIEVLIAFGLTLFSVEKLETVSQRFGKIANIDDDWRKRFIFELSTHHDIYSLGRFATWRNILLDDVIDDISVIKKLMNSNIYERSKINVK